MIMAAAEWRFCWSAISGLDHHPNKAPIDINKIYFCGGRPKLTCHTHHC